MLCEVRRWCYVKGDAEWEVCYAFCFERELHDAGFCPTKLKHAKFSAQDFSEANANRAKFMRKRAKRFKLSDGFSECECESSSSLAEPSFSRCKCRGVVMVGRNLLIFI